MRRIEHGGLVLVPRVTDMRNGSFRPEVAWSKGRTSDIIFGDTHTSMIRCMAIAEIAASASMTTGADLNAAWEECARALANCQGITDMLMTAFS